MDLTEVWLPTSASPHHEVSNLGRVRHIAGERKFASGKIYNKTGKLTRARLNKDGYYSVKFLGRPQRVHRLVATAFLPNPELKPTVNHKNGIKTDNRVENLEWCSTQENTRHSISALGNNPLKKGRKLTWDAVKEIRSVFKKEDWDAICHKYGIKSSSLFDVILHRSWRTPPKIKPSA